jgi:hypothetical protein
MSFINTGACFVSESGERLRHLFLVRIWQEPSSGTSTEWRGLVEHVPSQQRMYFKSLRDLDDFILLRIGSLAAMSKKDD